MDHEKWLEQHDRMMADHEIMMVTERETAARHEREMEALRLSQDKTERVLRWAIRLSIREHRNERKRRQELAEVAAKRHKELEEATATRNEEAAKRHQELEDLMKAFLKRGGNGKH
jgi:hypothetical protein